MHDELVLETVEQLRALAHPTRQRILRVLAANPHTNKQLAAALDETPARVHFHVRELEAAGFIELVEERPKGGVIEKYYRATASRFRLGSSFGSVEETTGLHEASLDAARQELARAVAYFREPLPNTRIAHEQAHLSTDELEKLQAHLDGIDQILRDVTNSSGSHKEKHKIMLTYLLHPVPPGPDHAEGPGQESSS